MKFNTANDAMEYIKENDLNNVPVEMSLCLEEQPKVKVLFGTIMFEQLKHSIVIQSSSKIGVCPLDFISPHIAIIYEIQEEKMMSMDDDIDNYCDEMGYMDYLIPSDFSGNIVYSEDFVRDMRVD
jgi:hypothetical protein